MEYPTPTPRKFYKAQIGAEVLSLSQEQKQALDVAVEQGQKMVRIGGREYRTYLYKRSWEVDPTTERTSPPTPALPGVNYRGLRRIQLCHLAVSRGYPANVAHLWALEQEQVAHLSALEQEQVATIRAAWLARKQARQADPERALKADFNAEVFDVDFPSFEAKKQAYQEWKARQEVEEVASLAEVQSLFGPGVVVANEQAEVADALAY